MDNNLIFSNNSLLDKTIYNEIISCNEKTYEYGLKLSSEDVKELINTRQTALKKCGRIEFNGEIIDKIIINFCNSPYISQYNYGETINELVEIFYEYKNETLDVISDDELIGIMKENFNNICQGSIELLEGKILYEIAENVRNGVKNYTDISDDKDW